MCAIMLYMNDVRKDVIKWAKTVGYQVAVGRLVSRGVSPRAAELLCSGDYPSQPKSLRDKLVEEMNKDGFPIRDGKHAS